MFYSRHKEFTAQDKRTEARVEELLSELSLEDKIDLLGGIHKGTAGKPEKGIIPLRFADGPMGVHWWCEESTAYPALIALAASWNRDLSGRMGRALGQDCLARGVHILLAPGVNIYRSALCGRNFEYLGEDPCLSAKLVVPYIVGVQDCGVAATVKHFAVNFQEYDRHGISSDADERTLREIYLPAFRAAVKEAGCAAVMNAYNLLNGRHCTENEWLNNHLLKGEWGFDGLLMSDWASTYDLVGIVQGGLDLEMPIAYHMNREKALPALRNGLITESQIDEKLRRQLRLMVCFGWLEREQQDSSIPEDDPASAAVALDIAREGCVLLKNNGILPLNRDKIKTVAVIGNNAHPAVISGGGSAFVTPRSAISVLDGIKAVAGDAVLVRHANGANPYREWDVFKSSRFTSPDGRDGLRGEYFCNDELSGEAALVRNDSLIDFHWGSETPDDEIKSDRFSVRWTGCINPTEAGNHILYANGHDCDYRVFLDGKEIMGTWDNPDSATQRVIVHLDVDRSCELRIEYRKRRGWTHVHFGWESERLMLQDRDRAIELARESDIVVLSTGFNQNSESEGYDRAFAMHPALDEFASQIAELNPCTVMVLNAGGNIAMDSWLDKAAALLYAWYPGQAGGTAVAEILFGEINPSGKLPATFEKQLTDRSSHGSYHDEDNDKRVHLQDGVFGGYRHFDRAGIAPQFPFGFGLSYTSFEFSSLALSASELNPEEELAVTCEIRNTGERAGAEVVQLYLRDCEASVPRPIKELKDFAKIQLAAGESARVELSIKPQDLCFFDIDSGCWLAEAGKFEVLIGSSCQHIHLNAEFTLRESFARLDEDI